MAVFPVVPLTNELARVASRLKHRYYLSHGTCLADAVVAATTESKRAALQTLNTKHYPAFPHFKQPYVETVTP